MTNNFNIVEFAGLSDERPWELQQPTPTDLRGVIVGTDPPSGETITQAFATFVGESIEAEVIDPPGDDVPWAARVRIEGLPTDILVWVEPLNESAREAAEIDAGYVLA